MWCSWIIEGKHTKMFFSGDSGYGPHFQEIGEKYGPFDLTLIEAGQYDNNGWWTLHMLPEETIQAHIDLRGKTFIPIHWGAFTLAIHDWDEPIERVLKAASQRNVMIAAPRIGEKVEIGSSKVPLDPWWRTYRRDEIKNYSSNLNNLWKRNSSETSPNEGYCRTGQEKRK